MSEPRVSVVIVSYRSRESLAECLPALQACRGRVPLEVIVVDNASGDGTEEWVRATHPWVRVIAAGANEGYSRGINRGVAVATGDAFLILNPDCIVTPGSLESLLAATGQRADLAAAAPALADEHGRVMRSCGRFPSLWTLVCDHLGPVRWFPNSHAFGGYKYGERSMASLGDVDWASGAALLVPRTAWERTGPFDGNIFMYMEEVDWCRRAATAGLRVQYVPAATIVHYGQRSSSLVPGATYLHNLRARVYYFRKHHGRLAAGCAQLVLIASLLGKWSVTALRGGLGHAHVYALGLRAVWEPPQERPI